MADNVVKKYPKLSALSGKYISTTYTNYANHRINNECDPYVNCGIWKNSMNQHWCVGYIYVSNSEDCSAASFNCECKLFNPSIANCPNEKMSSNWKHYNEDNGLTENVNTHDFQVQATIGQLH